ncbi:MAG: hypothetical protein ACREDJ_02770, partial [Methylocella sp.]
METIVMRDIRNDLRERLTSVLGRMADAQAEYDHDRNELERRFNDQFVAFCNERSSLETLLEIESRRQGEEPEVRQRLTVAAFRLPLADFLIYQLKERGPSSKDDLRAGAENHKYFPDGGSSGRRVHATLMNLVRSGRVREQPDGLY